MRARGTDYGRIVTPETESQVCLYPEKFDCNVSNPVYS